jgi:tetratricopeptide (TPR) repeat protein
MNIKYNQSIILFLSILFGINAISNAAILSKEAKDPQNAAVAELLEKLAETPRSSALYAELGWVYRSVGCLEKAKEAFAQAIALDPKDAKAYDGLGWCYLDEKDFKNAEVALRKAIEFNPGNYGTQIGVWYCCRHKGSFVEGEAFLQRALELAPGSDWVYFELGLCYSDQKKWDQAGQSFIEAFNRRVLPLEYTQEAEKKLFDVVQRFEKPFKHVLVHTPDSKELLNALGWVYRYQGRYKKAVVVFEKTLRQEPTQARACEGFAWCLQALNRSEEARGWFEKAVEYDPDSDGAYLGLGLYYFDQMNYAKSEEYLMKSLEINENNWRSTRNLMYCRHNPALVD